MPVSLLHKHTTNFTLPSNTDELNISRHAECHHHARLASCYAIPLTPLPLAPRLAVSLPVSIGQYCQCHTPITPRYNAALGHTPELTHRWSGLPSRHTIITLPLRIRSFYRFKLAIYANTSCQRRCHRWCQLHWVDGMLSMFTADTPLIRQSGRFSRHHCVATRHSPFVVAAITIAEMPSFGIRHWDTGNVQ